MSWVEMGLGEGGGRLWQELSGSSLPSLQLFGSLGGNPKLKAGCEDPAALCPSKAGLGTIGRHWWKVKDVGKLNTRSGTELHFNNEKEKGEKKEQGHSRATHFQQRSPSAARRGGSRGRPAKTSQGWEGSSSSATAFGPSREGSGSAGTAASPQPCQHLQGTKGQL